MPTLTLDNDEPTIATQLAKPETVCVFCLCAEWCSVCREYRLVFDQLADTHPTLCFIWLDIETHAGRLDEIDIENFPTILIGDASGTRFFGPVLPHSQVIERLLAHLPDLPTLADAPQLRALLADTNPKLSAEGDS